MIYIELLATDMPYGWDAWYGNLLSKLDLREAIVVIAGAKGPSDMGIYYILDNTFFYRVI
jgi:hypothetical protein